MSQIPAVIGKISPARYRRVPNAMTQRALHRMLSTGHRWNILHLLKQEDGKLRVSEIAKKLNVCQSYISLQLSILRANSILIRDRRGQKVFYTINKQYDLLMANLRFMPQKRQKQPTVVAPRKVRMA